MAEITRPVGLRPSIGSVLPDPHTMIQGCNAGEAIAAGDACYIKASDGLVWKATGAAANAAAKVRGFAMIPADAGEAVTLVNYMSIRYHNALTPGASLFLSGTTAGNLADAASTGGTAPVGFAIDAQRIYVWPATY